MQKVVMDTIMQIQKPASTSGQKANSQNQASLINVGKGKENSIVYIFK